MELSDRATLVGLERRPRSTEASKTWRMVPSNTVSLMRQLKIRDYRSSVLGQAPSTKSLGN